MVVVAAAMLTIALGAVVAPEVSAHSMTFLNAYTATHCLSPFSSVTVTIYNAVSPTDRTWVIRARVGLSGGDSIQSGRFDFYVLDNAIIAEVANYRHAGWHWVQTGQYTQAGTMTPHVGGTMTLNMYLFNEDQGQSQCYLVFARAAYM